MLKLGLRRSPAEITPSFQALVRKKLVASLAQLYRLGVRAGYKAIRSMEEAVAHEDHCIDKQYSASWARSVAKDVRDACGACPIFGFLNQDATRAVLTGREVNLKNLQESWTGITPDLKYNMKASSPSSVPASVSQNTYRQKICQSSSKKDAVDGLCYGKAQSDPSKCRNIKVGDFGQVGLDFEVDLPDSKILGTIMPDDLKEELRAHLNGLFAGEEGGVGIRMEWLKNAQRNLPCGTMGCFVRKTLNTDYASCRKNRHGAMGSLYETLGSLSGGFGAFLRRKFPQVWDEIYNTNAKEGWSCPSYYQHDDIFSPRLFVTDRIGNESHMDYQDIGPCVVFWLKESVEDSESDWHFIFEAVSTGEGEHKRDSLSIQIEDGLVLVFDGSKVRHCTSVPDRDSNRKYGVYYGTSKARL